MPAAINTCQDNDGGVSLLRQKTFWLRCFTLQLWPPLSNHLADRERIPYHTMHAYLALNVDDATCCEQGQMSFKVFANEENYVPLMESIEGALNQAKAAERDQWLIILVELSDEKALELSQEGVLSRERCGWHWWKDLDLAEVTAARWIHSSRAQLCMHMEQCWQCWNIFVMKESSGSQKPAVPQEMEAYIALNKHDALYCEERLVVPSKGWRSRQQYVPLRETGQKALANAIEKKTLLHESTRLLMAKQSTNWYILRMTFAWDKTLDFFQKGALVRMEEGWRFYSDLPFSEAKSRGWGQCTIPPMGIMPWACSALKYKRYSLRGSCIGCGARPVPVWTSRRQKKAFCGPCWHTFLMWARGADEGSEGNMFSEDNSMEA